MEKNITITLIQMLSLVLIVAGSYSFGFFLAKGIYSLTIMWALVMGIGALTNGLYTSEGNYYYYKKGLESK